MARDQKYIRETYKPVTMDPRVYELEKVKLNAQIANQNDIHPRDISKDYQRNFKK